MITMRTVLVIIKHRRALLSAVFFYSIIIVFVFGPALFPSPGQLIFGDDIHRQYYFYRQFFNNFFKEGVFPWWNPYLFGGVPFIANPVVNIWYPPTWLFVFLPLNTAYSWHLALHVLWAMLGMYVLTSKFKIQNSKFENSIGPWVGGVVFGLSGFFMARTWAGHVDVIAAASWMPWVFGAFWRLSTLSGSELRRGIVLAAGLFGLQLYAGYQTMAFFTVIAVGIMALVISVFSRSIRTLLFTLYSLLLGVGLAAIQLIPEQEFFRQSIRTFSLPYSWISYGSYTWKSLAQFINPFYFGNQLTYSGPPPNFIEHSAFIGIGGLVLVLVGIIGMIQRFLCAQVGISWFSRRQGPDLRSVHQRVSAKAVTALETKRLPALILGLSFVIITLFGLWMSLGSNASIDLQKILWQIIPMYHYLRIPPRHLILAVFGLSGLAAIGLSLIKNRTVQMSIGAVVVVEMVIFARTFITLKPLPQTRHDPELIRLFTADKQPHRLLQNFGVWLAQRDVLDADSVMSYGIFSATGYDPSILRSYYEFIAQSSGQKGKDAVLTTDVQVPYVRSLSGNALDELNIKYLMVPVDYDPFIGNARYRLLRENTRGAYRIYENTTVFPRFYFKNPSCGTAEIISYTPNRVEVATNAGCDTKLLSSEVWYPGWHAKVDGENIPIDKLNNTFRTIFVPLGQHTIVFEYSPLIFYISAGVSLFTACILLFWVREHR